jgi:hypothetical protein
MKYKSHYDYLDQHLPAFFVAMGLSWEWNQGIISAHGDKAYGYRYEWQEAGLHFYHGVAIYLLSYCKPFRDESRETANGWVPVHEWVLDNAHRFLPYLPPVEETAE